MYKYRIVDIHPNDAYSDIFEPGDILHSENLTLPEPSTIQGYTTCIINSMHFRAIKIEDITEETSQPSPPENRRLYTCLTGG